MKNNQQIICPFCGKDITETYTYKHTIEIEEKVKTDYSIERGALGKSILVEKQLKRNFSTYCCESCFKEYKDYQRLSERLSLILAILGFITGCIFVIVDRLNSGNFAFFRCILPCILTGILLAALFVLPVSLLDSICKKKTSYKHAQDCNSVR